MVENMSINKNFKPKYSHYVATHLFQDIPWSEYNPYSSVPVKHNENTWE